MQGFSSDLTDQLFGKEKKEVPSYYANNELIDWELFGKPPKEKATDFRWGTLDQLIELEREDKTQPLKLK